MPLGSSPTQFLEFAGGEEEPPVQESSSHYPQPASEILELVPSLPPLSNVSPLGVQGNIVDFSAPSRTQYIADEHAANIGLRRFSHPTPHVEPLIQESRPPTISDASMKSSLGRENVVSDAGRPALFEVSNSVANMLEFFRYKILEIENRIVSLLAQRENDAKLQNATAGQVDKIFRILDAASRDVLSSVDTSNVAHKSIAVR